MPRPNAPVPRPPAPASRAVAVLRDYWWALATVLLVGISALFPASPVRDAATGLPLAEASLRLPSGYVLLAPVSALLDTLTLLSLRQHLALLVTLIVIFAIWWVLRGHVVPAELSGRRRLVRRLARVGIALVGLLAAYACAILMPRPMAALEVSPTIVTVDFHAHTEYSHDGRWNWTPEDVRAWHRDAGYAAAYISDHRTFEGARDGWANNPPLAGEGTSLFPAIEVGWKGEHVNLLDADRVYKGLLTSTLRDIDQEALVLASAIPGREPVVIETLPGDLGNFIPANGSGTAGVRAIELIDGSPKGLGQTRRARARILHLADSLNLALVSGSDSHGWGHVAQGWTLFTIPNWRGASPEALADAISRTIRGGGFRATRVVERWIPDTDSGIALPFTVPVVLWGMLRTLSPEERALWLLWTLVAVGLYRFRQQRRAELLG